MFWLFYGIREFLRLVRHTPLWLFFVTFAIQSIPFNPVPNYIPIAAYIAYTAREPYQLTLSVVLSALGAAVGKLVVLKFGDWLKGVMPARSRESFRRLLSLVPKDKLDLAVFAIAASPLPDDEVYLILRAGDYDAKRLVAVLIPAKLLWASMHVLYALATYRAVRYIAGDVGLWAYMGAISGISLALTIAALRLDWGAVLDAYRAGGVKLAVKAALKSLSPFKRL
ncbi:MAG: hypothetical protein QXP98_02655 [Thermoproteus sp.]